ncbi:salutaridinol 7-O-acetyltransferase-like [Papaver somniferum]|uniref:salutaridinol 7-O-acetyltransferase-like n=1 Tax=Papaver somniferum TaxID=3469 RepID=UPI000E702D5D|nr:salutaridinol 7-O-acetyltransferase-like [Papaver somniferum]
MDQFIPINLRYNTESGTCRDNLVQLVTQVNMFDCGGMVVGVSVLHNIADAASLSIFVNAWARTNARIKMNDGGHYEEGESIIPTFDGAFHFPPKDVPNVLPFKMDPGNSDIVTVCKRFVFVSSKIVALKAKDANNLHVANPTKVELVTALLWQCASNLKFTVDSKPSMLCIAVNILRRMVPPLSDHSIGSLIALALVGPLKKPGEDELHELVGSLRSSI